MGIKVAFVDLVNKLKGDGAIESFTAFLDYSRVLTWVIIIISC